MNSIYEFRIDFGPGYRIYYGIKGNPTLTNLRCLLGTVGLEIAISPAHRV